MKKLVTPNFRNKLASIFPQMFEYNCCAKGTHEKFLQYALFSPYKSVTTGAVLFDQETVARIVGKEASVKNGNFKSGPYLNHFINELNKVSTTITTTPCIYTCSSEDKDLIHSGKVATLYTDHLGRDFHPGLFATAGELNEYEKIVKGRLVTDMNPDRLIKIEQGMCRQVNFSFSKEVLDMVEDELVGAISTKRNGKVYFVSGKPYTYYLNRKDTNSIEESVNNAVDLLDNEVSQQIAAYMNSLPIGLFEEIIEENLDSALLEIAHFIEDEEVKSQQLAILNGIADQPKVYYRPSKNNNTDRLFGYGTNITGLKKEVRKVLTRGWFECDARNLHLAIVAKLWKIPSLQNFLASGKSFWNLIQNALETDSVKAKGYIKEATYGLVYGMSKKNLVARLNEQLGQGMGEKFLEINLIKDILEARTHAMSYYMATGSIVDAYGKSFKVTKDNILSLMARVCQSYEQKLMLSIYKLTDKCNDDFFITLYQFDGLSIKFNCNKEEWIKTITNTFNQAALEMGIYTTLAWSFLDEIEQLVEEEVPVIDVAVMQEQAAIYKTELTDYSVYCYFLGLSDECLKEFINRSNKKRIIDSSRALLIKGLFY